jgi:hypothetical protein
MRQGGAGAVAGGGQRSEPPIVLIPGSTGPVVVGRGPGPRPIAISTRTAPQRTPSATSARAPIPVQAPQRRPPPAPLSAPPGQSTQQRKPSKQATSDRLNQIALQRQSDQAAAQRNAERKSADRTRDAQEAAQAVLAARPKGPLARLFGGKVTAADMRRGLIVQEILSPPLALRDVPDAAAPRP